MLITNEQGATPIEPDDLYDLLVDVQTHQELNEYEALNITDGIRKASRDKMIRGEGILTVSGILRLHKLMLGDVWKWAGVFRQTDVMFGNRSGVAPVSIHMAVHGLCGTALWWKEAETFSWSETAARFHHELVIIHPFKNGNGRHSRLATDLFCDFAGQPRPSWSGGGSLVAADERRAEYMTALHEADAGDMSRLISFLWS